MTDTKKSESDFVSIKEASKITGIQPQTLRKLGDENKIQCYKTISGQRKFHKASLQAMCYSGEPAKNSFSNKQNFIYVRVLNNNLYKDLQKNVDLILSKDIKYNEYNKITDVCSETVFKRKGLQTILKACFQKNIGEIVVLNSETLGSIGYDLIENIVYNCGGKITILNNEDTNNYSKTNNTINELIYILQIFSGKIGGFLSKKNSVNPSLNLSDENENEIEYIDNDFNLISYSTDIIEPENLIEKI